MGRFVPLFAVSILCGCADQPAPNAKPADSVAIETTASATALQPQPLDARLVRWLRAKYGSDQLVFYKAGYADLDGDGRDEALVFVGGPDLCGSGGCNLAVFKDSDGQWAPIGQLTVTQLPVGVLDTKTNGFLDLAVTTYGGGPPAAIMKVPFDGRAYASNPTVAPASETKVIGRELIAAGQLERLD